MILFDFNIELIILVVVILSILTLGLLIFSRNSKSDTHRSFLFFSISVSLWSISNYIISLPLKPSVAIWALRSVMFTAVWFAFSIFWLFHAFPNEISGLSKKKKLIALILTAIISVLTLMPFVFKDISEFTAEGKISKATNNFGIYLFGVYVLYLNLSGIVNLIKKTLKARGSQRSQFIFVFFGIFLTISLILIFNFILPAFFKYSKFVFLGPTFILPFVALTSYAIVKHRLFNIKVIATEFLTFGLWVTLLIRIFLTDNFTDRIIGSLIFLTAFILGLLLVRSVLKEVKMREEMELLAKKLEIANERLKKLDQEKSEFLSIASHQLRAPMTVIKGYISLIMEGSFGKINEGFKEVFNKIYISNERLIKVIDDLLDLSRIERGKMEYNFKVQSFEKLVSEIVKELTPLAEQKELKIVWQPPTPALPEISFDESYLRQVILNLIDNAIKYSEQGKIEIKAEKKEHSLLLSIKDEGMGIPKETMPYLFQRYSRGEKVYYRATEGMGLGLYVAKKIVDDHHGKIWAESEGEGRGSIFFVELSFIP